MELRGKLLAACALLCLGCTSEMAQVARLVDDARVNARVGVLANTEVGWITETKNLERAFRFYRQNKVDAVVLTGRVTKNGYRDQFEVLDKVWRKVFEGTATRLIKEPGDYEVSGFAFAVVTNRPMSARSDVLTFHGVRKTPLTDEICFHPRDSRQICAGSMHGVELPNWYMDKKLKARAAAAAQGLLVSAYSGKTVVRRLDFTAKEVEDVGDPWEIGADGVGVAPAEVPEFWPDTQVQVLTGFRGTNAVYTVKWPSVLKRTTGARARWYEVGVAYADAPEKLLGRQVVISDNFHLSERCDLAGVQHAFAAAELPPYDSAHPSIVFFVTPIGCYGKRGKTIRSAAVPIVRQ